MPVIHAALPKNSAEPHLILALPCPSVHRMEACATNTGWWPGHTGSAPWTRRNADRGENRVLDLSSDLGAVTPVRREDTKMQKRFLGFGPCELVLLAICVLFLMTVM